MQDCIFCKIVNREIPADILYEDDKAMVFKDINPAAPVHLLIISKGHISKLLEAGEEDREVLGHIQYVAARMARELKLESFRLVNNCGEEAGQSVFHIHYHLLSGKKFHWPPG